MSSLSISRRDFLRGASVISAGFLLGNNLDSFGRHSPRLRTTQASMEPFVPDAEISIAAAPKTVQILAGAPTTVWSYEGQLLSGSGVTVQNLPGIYLGPILRVKSGTKVRIYFHNNLAEKSVIHPHGLRVPEDCDGQPMQAIDPGQTKIYDFQVIDRAAPAWFHPHPMGRTAEQVMMGMAGLFNVWDADEEHAVPGASTGANDIPVILQDRNFDSNNSSIPHPMHIHNIQFQVVQRTPPASTSSYNTANQGFVDSGWKDTVLVWPGERVKVAMKFEPYTGMYMYHCHILEHEDMTMMRNYMIMDPGMPGM